MNKSSKKVAQSSNFFLLSKTFQELFRFKKSLYTFRYFAMLTILKQSIIRCHKHQAYMYPIYLGTFMMHSLAEAQEIAQNVLTRKVAVNKNEELTLDESLLNA